MMKASSLKPRYKKDLVPEVRNVYLAQEEPFDSNSLEFKEEKVNLDQLLQKLAAEYDAIMQKLTPKKEKKPGRTLL